MQKIFTCLTIVLWLLPRGLTAQSTGDFQSAQTGPWNDIATWQTYNGTTWVAATAPPTVNQAITILNGHTVSITSPVTANGITVATGAVLNATAGGANTLTIASTPGIGLRVDGTFNLSGGTLGGFSSTMNIYGILNLGPAQTTISPGTTIRATGIVNITGDNNKILSGGWDNYGTVNWATGANAGDLDIGNSFNNFGTINEQFQSNRGFTSGGFGLVQNDGTIHKQTTFSLTGSATYTCGATGVLKGIGTFIMNGTLSNSGTIAPGSSPGILQVSPATLAGSPKVAIELLNTSGPGTGHDQLVVTGPVNLSNVTFNVTDIAGGTSLPAGNYTIATTGSGNFSGSPVVNLPPGMQLVSTLPLTGNTLVISVINLPLVWGSFTAIASANKTDLNWQTLSESNTSHFNIEYSNDGRSYRVIGTVAASGNSPLPVNYHYTHQPVNTSAHHYYRIAQYDLDGRASHSVARLVTVYASDVQVQVSPNPVRDVLNVQVGHKIADLQLIGIHGQTISRHRLPAGVHQLNLRSLPAGHYTLQVIVDTRKVQTIQLIRQ